MKVILKKDIDKLGSFGERVEVAPGYARNYLFPGGYAWPDEPRYANRVEGLRRQIEEKMEREKESALETAARIQETSLTVEMEAGEEDRLFGTVTEMDVAVKLQEAGFDIDRKNIEIEEPIKKLGVYKASVRLHPEVEAACKVWVVKK